MASRPSETGKMGRLVKMDYSVTYRDNDKLDLDLDDHLINLTRCAQRTLSEKEDELESARADADRILRLKEAVNNREEGEASLAILCHSAPSLRRKSSDLSGPAHGRKMSSATNASGRRISVMSSARDSVAEEGEEKSVMDYTSPSSGQPLPDMKKMSLTERRLAKERDQFSAKNLFNVRRNHSNLLDSRRRDVSPDTSRTTTPTSPLQPSSSSKSQGRPMTSPASYNRRSAHKTRSYMRPTTASSRLVSFAADGEEDGFQMAPRRPRSRRELQRLVELKIDPFEEEASEKAERWSGERDKGALLGSMQAGQVQLQARVRAFLSTLEDFNRRRSQTPLQHLLTQS